MIATILPAAVFTGNSLNYLIPWHFEANKLLENPSNVSECYELTMPFITLAYLCGVLNSFTLDYVLRTKISANVNMFYLYQLPVPRLASDDPRSIAIANRVARLICVGSEFDELRRELLGDVNAHVALDSIERRQIQSEIDGLAAHLYRLTLEEFKDVLNTFPLVQQPIKDSALHAYRMFDLEPEDLHLAELVAKGETQKVEFKVTACLNLQPGKKGDSPINYIIQEVAAFLNSREGGVVLIGIEDNGTVVGLKDDFIAANPQKQNRDGYQLFLLDNLKNNLVSNCSLFYKISFGRLQGKDVCRIDVAPSIEQVFIKGGDFYIREGNRKRKLSPQDTVTYIKQRFV